jgi:ferric-dicitrate binding protein FerR (iron transport regulator)
MSRRSFPRIDPASLRDHADEATVERVWDRIEHDLHSRVDRWGPNGFEAPSGRARRSMLAYVAIAIAASFAAFGGGLLLGKATWDHKLPVETPVAAAVIEKSTVEVLAAGSQSRTFPLQGGGQITLLPGGTVEVERAGTTLTVALLQGEAVVTTATSKGAVVTAGEARLNTQAGSQVTVTRNQDDVDVQVSSGKVSVTSPLGATRELGEHDRVQVPIRAAVSSAPINNAAPRHAPAMIAARRPPGPRPIAVKTGPEWLIRHDANDDEGALAILRKQGVSQSIDTAHGAAELMAIAEIMSGKGRDQAAEVHAWERLLQGFPNDQRASLAANRLAAIYEARGETARAKEYRDKVQPLAQNATTGADSLVCNLIRQEADKSKAAVLAKLYLDKYPDGECRDDCERLAQGTAPAPSADPSPGPAPAAPTAPTAPTAAPPAPRAYCRPIPLYSKPSARTSSGAHMLRPSKSTGSFISFLSRWKSGVRYSCHSVTSTSASAPSTAPYMPSAKRTRSP